MRTLTDHKCNPLNDALEIEILDAPGAGGASHNYLVVTPMDKTHTREQAIYQSIKFQNGPINEAGINGLTQEVLLAIVIDRLRCFQKGEFTCRENALALTKCEEALMWLHARTRARMRRNVEGTSIK